ncbi:hypothetical protein N800_02760 [Lysobacter daejeonensis GH1-9]|uniref:DUF1254 domain-containing protein n=2 Tax=Aerolutibacter TaxID=3382701 RepID=A0A0A0ENF1_9GAMM|nr:hypothetical protein N800_02760 [Lysobacter daejeonensis GH1-9]
MRAIVIALLLVSSSALAKHVYPQHLTPVADGARYTLAEPYVFKEKAATFTLRPGEYVQHFEDRKAIYLLGGEGCADMNVVPPKQPEHAYTMTFNCGILVPKDDSKGAAFFFIRGKSQQTQSLGLIINAIIKAGEGSFDFPTSRHDDAALRARLIRVQP